MINDCRVTDFLEGSEYTGDSGDEKYCAEAFHAIMLM